MSFSRSYLIHPVLALLFVLTGVFTCSSTAMAQSEAISAAQYGLKVMSRRLHVNTKKTSTNFSGGWHGKLVLTKSNCSGFAAGFLFRHIVTMKGNRVAIATSHDGTLTGISRDAGKKLQASRSYNRNGFPVDVALVYQNLKANTVGIGFAASIVANNVRCTAAYGAVGIRAF